MQTVEKQEVVVGVTRKYIALSFLLCLVGVFSAFAQDSTQVYKKRVLETTEIDFLTSFYSQDGDSAAVSGGLGTEELTDVTPTFVISIPLNADDILTIDAGISAYTSASSSNVDPFDARENPDPYRASTGASSGDTWMSVNGTYSHSSDDRNKVWSATISIANEYDYTSTGIGGSRTWLFNKKNTELSWSGNIYIDTWNTIYPSELRPFSEGPVSTGGSLFGFDITGNTNYNPNFKPFDKKGRNSYSTGLSFSQILSKNMQGVIMLDLVQQSGLLSTPFQRVYFADVDDAYIGNFLLADDVERLPDNRFKTAIGGRLNYYINEHFILRNYYRFYTDNWGITSQTYSIEIPIKLGLGRFTVYPSYRFYNQTASDHFASYNKHLSSSEFYTSDNDLSEYNANQFGFGINYTDVFTKFHLGKFALKSVDLKYSYYERNTGLSATLISAGVKFVVDKPKSIVTSSK